MTKTSLNKLKNIAGDAARIFDHGGIWATDRVILLHSTDPYEGDPLTYDPDNLLPRVPELLTRVDDKPKIPVETPEITALLRAFKLLKSENYHMEHPTVVHIGPQGTIILQNWYDEDPTQEGGPFMSAFSPTPSLPDPAVPVTFNAYYFNMFRPADSSMKVASDGRTLMYETTLDSRHFTVLLAAIVPSEYLQKTIDREMPIHTGALKCV